LSVARGSKIGDVVGVVSHAPFGTGAWLTFRNTLLPHMCYVIVLNFVAVGAAFSEQAWGLTTFGDAEAPFLLHTDVSDTLEICFSTPVLPCQIRSSSAKLCDRNYSGFPENFIASRPARSLKDIGTGAYQSAIFEFLISVP